MLERANEKFEFPVHWGVDLQSEHERYLTEKYAKKPVIVMNYPKAIKAFYMRLNDDGRTVAAMDVLAPGIGEIIGGSQREERLDGIGPQHGRARHRPRPRRLVPRPTLATVPLPAPAPASLGAPSPTSPASPMSATPSPSREPAETPGIDSYTSAARAHARGNGVALKHRVSRCVRRRNRRCRHAWRRGMAENEIEVFETTAGQVMDVLSRLGVAKERMVTVVVETGRLADKGPAGNAPAGDQGRSQRRRYRSPDRSSARGSAAAAGMRLVVDTNVCVSAALKASSLPFIVVR